MSKKRNKNTRTDEADRRSSIASLEKLTDVETDYPLVYNKDIRQLGGMNTTEERYPVDDMEDYE